MTTTKKAIISFANRNGNYMQGLARLSDSLRNNFDGDFLSFVGEGSLGCLPHSESPYSFKPIAMQKAIDTGYTKLLWLDASCFAIANVQPIFDHISKQGFIFQEAGYSLGEWCNDRTLAAYHITRDEAMNIKLVGNAGFFGIDMSHGRASGFMHMYINAMREGLFIGKWNNDDQTESKDTRCRGHRHDISVLSCIIHKLGLSHLIVPGNEWLQYAGIYDKTANETIIIKASGM